MDHRANAAMKQVDTMKMDVNLDKENKQGIDHRCLRPFPEAQNKYYENKINQNNPLSRANYSNLTEDKQQ